MTDDVLRRLEDERLVVMNARQGRWLDILIDWRRSELKLLALGKVTGLMDKASDEQVRQFEEATRRSEIAHCIYGDKLYPPTGPFCRSAATQAELTVGEARETETHPGHEGWCAKCGPTPTPPDEQGPYRVERRGVHYVVCSKYNSTGLYDIDEEVADAYCGEVNAAYRAGRESMRGDGR